MWWNLRPYSDPLTDTVVGHSRSRPRSRHSSLVTRPVPPPPTSPPPTPLSVPKSLLFYGSAPTPPPPRPGTYSNLIPFPSHSRSQPPFVPHPFPLSTASVSSVTFTLCPASLVVPEERDDRGVACPASNNYCLSTLGITRI